MEQFRNELYEHLSRFRFPEGYPRLPVTLTGHPRTGLSVAYRHPNKDPAGPDAIIKEAAKAGAAAGVGAIGGAAAGVIIGEAIFGTVVPRVGIASAGAAIGVPVLAPLAVVGGVMGSGAYALYKLGQWKRDKEMASDLASQLVKHMDEFSPSVPYPCVEVYVSIRHKGLSVFWQPELDV